MRTFADWEIDYLKFDWCGVNEVHRNGQAGSVFQLWNNAIDASGRDMVVAASTWGWENEGSWGPSYAHTWRIDGDVLPAWNDILRTLDKGSTSTLRSASGPAKGWNDFDTLQTGNPGLTEAEGRSQFYMWAISNSPLILGNDLSTASPGTLAMFGNPEIIAVNQDSMGEQAWLAKDTGGLQVWGRSLADGTKAVALLNRTSSAANMTVNFADVFLGSTVGSVRDLGNRVERGVHTTSYTTNVGAHDTIVLKVRPATLIEAESGSRAGGAAIQNCATCSGGKNVGYVGNNAGTLTLTTSVPKAGVYDITIFYNSGDTRSVYLAVNGGTATEIAGLNSGSWTTVAAVTVPVVLNAGSNTLVLSNPGSGAWAPDLDRLAVTSQ